MDDGGLARVTDEELGYVLHDQETAELLLAHAQAGKDKHEVATALQALSRCTPPAPLDSKPLVALARRKEWQVWQEAVKCLHLAPAEEVEPVLLERMNANRYGVTNVAFELRHFRSQRSLEALEYLLGHEALDVRCIALDSLGKRLGSGVLPYARRLAAGRQHQEKWWAERWLAEHGTVDDIPFMVGPRQERRASRQRSRIRALVSRDVLAPLSRRSTSEDWTRSSWGCGGDRLGVARGGLTSRR